MAKTNKIFCIDEELIDLLKKEESQSALVNRLLLEHYQKSDLNMMNEKQLKELIEIEEFKEQHDLELKTKIKEIKEKWARS